MFSLVQFIVCQKDVPKTRKSKYLKAHGEKPEKSNSAYKEWAPSVKLLRQNIIRIIHSNINGRATVNLKIYFIIVLIIVELKKVKGKKIEKKMKMKSRGKEKQMNISDKRKLLFVPYCWCGYSAMYFAIFLITSSGDCTRPRHQETIRIFALGSKIEKKKKNRK